MTPTTMYYLSAALAVARDHYLSPLPEGTYVGPDCAGWIADAVGPLLPDALRWPLLQDARMIQDAWLSGDEDQVLDMQAAMVAKWLERSLDDMYCETFRRCFDMVFAYSVGAFWSTVEMAHTLIEEQRPLPF